MQKTFGILIYLPFILLPLLISCYTPRYVYSPSTQNISPISKKGDIGLSGYFATGGGSSRAGAEGSLDYNLGMDLQGAYAFTNHFGVMLNTYNRWERNTGGNDFVSGNRSVVRYKRGLAELGVGYFAPLRKKLNNSFFQVFAGTAVGKFKINDMIGSTGQQASRFHISRVTKLFIQPAIIIGQQQDLTASFSSRFSALFYHKINTDYTSGELNNYLLADLSSSPVFFWEPAMNYSLAFKKIKGLRASLQTGIAVLINQKFVDYRTINLAFGVMADNDVFRKVKK